MRSCIKEPYTHSLLFSRLAGESGTHVYTSKWKDFDIVYHVAPLIPARKSDRQQIHRKRHVGNGMLVEWIIPFTPKKSNGYTNAASTAQILYH
jgi:hypothetical protein